MDGIHLYQIPWFDNLWPRRRLMPPLPRATLPDHSVAGKRALHAGEAHGITVPDHFLVYDLCTSSSCPPDDKNLLHDFPRELMRMAVRPAAFSRNRAGMPAHGTAQPTRYRARLNAYMSCCFPYRPPVLY